MKRFTQDIRDWRDCIIYREHDIVNLLKQKTTHDDDDDDHVSSSVSEG